MTSHAYIFFGKSGSGKGTQAELLKQELEKKGRTVIYIETGQLLRNFIASGDSHLHDQTKSIIENGKLMPVFFPVYLWARVLVEQYTGSEDIIFDGVSRRIEEAPIIDSALDFLGIENRTVLDIMVSDQWVIDRLSARGRADDSVEGIQKRLSWFESNVVPVLEYFKINRKYTFLDIIGEQTIEAVHTEIMTKIDVY
jgi:adenylate kinase